MFCRMITCMVRGIEELLAATAALAAWATAAITVAARHFC